MSSLNTGQHQRKREEKAQKKEQADEPTVLLPAKNARYCKACTACGLGSAIIDHQKSIPRHFKTHHKPLHSRFHGVKGVLLSFSYKC
jgi:hypothetical protein